MTIRVRATKYRLEPECIYAGTRGSYGNEKLLLAFDDAWNGLAVYVVFFPLRGKPVQVPYITEEIDIPAEITAYSGMARYVVSGVKIGDDGAVERRIITLEGHINVQFTPDAKGGNARKVTPDTYDLFLSQAKDYIDDIVDENREQLQGKPGEPGASGVFVKEDGADSAPENANVEVDLTEDGDEPYIWIPDSLVREGNLVWMLCDGEKVGEPFEIVDGVPGKNFTILGYYGTLDELNAAVSDPEPGDAYGIGTAAPYNAYVFDGVTREWIDNGQLSGVAGADGVGIRSVEQTTTSDEDGGENILTVTLTNGVTSQFTVKNGRKGSPGNTPQRGTDYWTAADQKAIVDAVLEHFTDVSEVAM